MNARHSASPTRWGSALRPRGSIAALVALAALLSPAAARAQGGAGGTTRAVSVYRMSDLSFGIVVGGIPAQVKPADATAAKFEIRGPKQSGVTVTLTLPPALTMGAAAMPITFGTSSAGWSDQDKANTMTLFDPQQGTQVTLPANGKVYIWIGGALNPPTRQASGTYGGVITLSVTAN